MYHCLNNTGTHLLLCMQLITINFSPSFSGDNWLSIFVYFFSIKAFRTRILAASKCSESATATGIIRTFPVIAQCFLLHRWISRLAELLMSELEVAHAYCRVLLELWSALCAARPGACARETPRLLPSLVQLAWRSSYEDSSSNTVLQTEVHDRAVPSKILQLGVQFQGSSPSFLFCLRL
jgi:hypothetical protein